jgi:hypothetical protein
MPDSLVRFVSFMLTHVVNLYDLVREMRQFDEFTPTLLRL